MIHTLILKDFSFPEYLLRAVDYLAVMFKIITIKCFWHTENLRGNTEISVFLFFYFLFFYCSVAVVPIFPCCSPLPLPPLSPCSHNQFPPCCPWVIYTCSVTRPFPFFLPLSLSPLPSDPCLSVPCFHASGSTLLVCSFYSLGSTYR